jgi:hypothetical protein
MEVLLIDIGALAVFLAYIAIVYWHGVSHDTKPASAEAREVHYAVRESATARSARSSVEIGQCSSQLRQ